MHGKTTAKVNTIGLSDPMLAIPSRESRKGHSPAVADLPGPVDTKGLAVILSSPLPTHG